MPTSHAERSKKKTLKEINEISSEDKEFGQRLAKVIDPLLSALIALEKRVDEIDRRVRKEMKR